MCLYYNCILYTYRNIIEFQSQFLAIYQYYYVNNQSINISIILQLSIIYTYLKQLENEDNNQLTVPNENQKEIVLLLAVSK